MVLTVCRILSLAMRHLYCCTLVDASREVYQMCEETFYLYNKSQCSKV